MSYYSTNSNKKQDNQTELIGSGKVITAEDTAAFFHEKFLSSKTDASSEFI
jgi:hypothetical protein